MKSTESAQDRWKSFDVTEGRPWLLVGDRIVDGCLRSLKIFQVAEGRLLGYFVSSSLG